jgi:FkbM family methyltransferase
MYYWHLKKNIHVYKQTYSMLCFDIGANIGSWTITNKDEYSKIISVEASETTYTELVKNMANLGDRCVPLNYAVCNNNNEEVTFYSSTHSDLSSLNKEWYSEKSRFANIPYTAIRCKSITLDKLIEEYGKPELIKIDVEGGEYEVISSLSSKTQTLCFEWATEMNDITFKCLDHLYNLGYEEYCVQYSDAYTYRPQTSDYKSMNDVKSELMNTRDKIDWGMIWAR